jgi:hypothetical protein
MSEPTLPDLPARLRMLKRGTTIEVRWLDSTGRHTWINHDEAERWAKVIGGVEHRSCGYFFTVTDDALVIAQSMVEYPDGADANVNACMSIPVLALRGLRVLQ